MYFHGMQAELLWIGHARWLEMIDRQAWKLFFDVETGQPSDHWRPVDAIRRHLRQLTRRPVIELT